MPYADCPQRFIKNEELSVVDTGCIHTQNVYKMHGVCSQAEVVYVKPPSGVV